MKYIGSKAKYAAEIVPLLQDIIERYDVEQYVEPFVGGFNIIDKIECEYRLGNDIDPLVCNLVEACRERPRSTRRGIARQYSSLRPITHAFTAGVTEQLQKQRTVRSAITSRRQRRILSGSCPLSAIS